MSAGNMRQPEGGSAGLEREEQPTPDTTLETNSSETSKETTDKPHSPSFNIEETLADNSGNGVKLDGRTSHMEEGTTHGFENVSSNQRSSTCSENSNYKEEIVESSTPGLSMNSQNIQKGNMKRDSAGYSEEINNYTVKNATDLRTSVTISRNNSTYERNMNEKSAEVISDVLNETSEHTLQSTEGTASNGMESKKEFDQSPLRTNSAEVSLVNITSKDEFTNMSNVTNPSRYIQSGATVTTLGNKEIISITKSVDCSDMMTETSVEFNSEDDASTQENFRNYKEHGMTSGYGLISGSHSEAGDNSMENSPIKTKSTHSRHSADGTGNATGAGKVTSSDSMVTGKEPDVSSQSILSDTEINVSHERGYSNEEANDTYVRESDATSKHELSNESFPEISDSNLDFVPTKKNNLRSKQNVKKEDAFRRSGGGKMSRSDTVVADSESNTFYETSSSITEMNVNVNEPKNGSSEKLFISEPEKGATDLYIAPVTTGISAQHQHRDMISLDHTNGSQLVSDNLIKASAVTMLPEEDAPNHDTSSKQSWNSGNSHHMNGSSRRGEVLSKDNMSSHETNFENKSKDVNSSEPQILKGNDRESIDASSIYEANSSGYGRSNVFIQGQSKKISSENTKRDQKVTSSTQNETWISTEHAKGETSNKISKISDETSVTSSDNERAKKQNVSDASTSLENSRMKYGMISETEKDCKVDGFTTTNVFNALKSTEYSSRDNNIHVSNANKIPDEIPGVGRGVVPIPDQKTGSSPTDHQISSGSGSPQGTNNVKELWPGFSQRRSLRNDEMNLSAMYPEQSYVATSTYSASSHRPSSVVLPGAMKFLIYANEVLPAQNSHYAYNPYKDRGSGTPENIVSPVHHFVYRPQVIHDNYSVRPNPYYANPSINLKSE